MNKERLKEILIYLGIVFLIIGGVVYYFDYQNKQLILDYNSQFADLNSLLYKEIQETESELKANISDTKKELSSDIDNVNTNLKSLDDKTGKEINALSSLIDEIEAQANLKLDQLQSELKDVQIKSADFSAIIDDVLQAVVSVKTNLGQGSGAVIRSNGYIVTNFHVIKGASTIKVIDYDEYQYTAEIVGYDTKSDIAVLKIDEDLNTLEFGDSDEVKVGAKVIAAGNPAGFSFTVTEGIVSALRTFSNNIDYIQTDVPINPGNSGGPLINQKGEIIGINNFKWGGFESLGFAIASDEVDRVVNSLISDYEQKLAEELLAEQQT